MKLKLKLNKATTTTTTKKKKKTFNWRRRYLQLAREKKLLELSINDDE